MTFFEAAVAVLREAGRPLHFKKIAQQAVARGLLSHVGKSPEDTMSARLAQEVAKPAGASLIEEVRPNVFGLRSGVDVDDASETITLRTFPDDVPEPEPVTDDSELEDDAQPVAPPSVIRPDDDGRRRGRRRSRRGGNRGRSDAPNAASDDDAADNGDDEDAFYGDELGEVEAETDIDSGEATPIAAIARTDELGDVAAAAVTVLERADGRPYSASKVANELARAGVGALGPLGTAALRSTLEAENARRARQGRPPVFEEVKPNFWALAAASGSSLARSYAALERWQVTHRAALAATLAERLATLDDAALGSLITLLLDRLGYTELKADQASPVTVAARSPSGLTSTRVAARLFTAADRVGRAQVAALRGSLHQYRAAAGVVFALGPVDGGAREEVDVPNVAPISLLDARMIAEMLVDAGVGVARFSVDVSCLDDALFRELKKG